MSLLRIEDVTKSFSTSGGRAGRRLVLDHVSLALGENEFATVVGPSGCGKTTLLRLVAGFDQPDSGSVRFDGREVRGPGAERVVVFQQPGLYPWLDVRHNVAFGLRLARRKVDWDRVDEMIATVGLRGFERHASYELSGGMQQRVALARSLIMAPRMLLLDEPLAALDAHLRRTMQEFLLELWQRIRTTVLFITHDVDEAILLGDRVVVMGASPGRILVDQPVDLDRPRGAEIVDEEQFRRQRSGIVQLLRTPGGASPRRGAADNRHDDIDHIDVLNELGGGPEVAREA